MSAADREITILESEYDQIKSENYRIKDELYALKEEIYKLKDECYALRSERDELKAKLQQLDGANAGSASDARQLSTRSMRSSRDNSSEMDFDVRRPAHGSGVRRRPAVVENESEARGNREVSKSSSGSIRRPHTSRNTESYDDDYSAEDFEDDAKPVSGGRMRGSASNSSSIRRPHTGIRAERYDSYEDDEDDEEEEIVSSRRPSPSASGSIRRPHHRG